MVQSMPRQEWWRHEYRQLRYLEFASKEELKQRFQDLFGNICDLNAEGKIAFKNPLNDGGVMIRFTHLLEEFRLRGEPIGPELLHGAHFTGRRYVNAKRAAEVWSGCKAPPGNYLLKFGKWKHLQPLLNAGNLRVAPASFYRDPSLNLAIQDTELEFTQEYYGAKVFHPPAGDYTIPPGQWVEMPVIGNVKSTLRAHNDYYIACFSASHENRLYDDFDADSCLVIKDVDRFTKSLQARMKEVLPGWQFRCGAVEYRDPHYSNQQLNIFFCKHFRYEYQKEFRFVWESRSKCERLRPINLELGPLSEYCDLLTIFDGSRTFKNCEM